MSMTGNHEVFARGSRGKGVEDVRRRGLGGDDMMLRGALREER